jgi:L-ribulose-5-phosphate 3-epimerase
MQNRNYAVGMYEKAVPSSLPWTGKLAAAKTAGYDFVEMSIDETEEKLSRLDMSAAERMYFLNVTQVTGMPVRSICLSGHRKYPLGSSDCDTERKSLVIMEKAVRLAADLGIRIIMLPGYDVYYEQSDSDTKRRFEINLAKCVDMAARESILLGFETMETPFMDTVRKAVQYVGLINSPYLAVYPDLGNITNSSCLYGSDAADDLQYGSGHILAVHVKETLPGKYREVPFGTGHVDFDRLLRTCWSLRVRRYVTELWYTGNDDWQLKINEACAMVRNILDKLE